MDGLIHLLYTGNSNGSDSLSWIASNAATASVDDEALAACRCVVAYLRLDSIQFKLRSTWKMLCVLDIV